LVVKQLVRQLCGAVVEFKYFELAQAVHVGPVVHHSQFPTPDVTQFGAVSFTFFKKKFKIN